MTYSNVWKNISKKSKKHRIKFISNNKLPLVQQKFRGYYRTWHPLNSFAYENTKLNIASSPKIILQIKSRSIFVYNRLFITSALVTWSCGFSIWLNWQPIWTCRTENFRRPGLPPRPSTLLLTTNFWHTTSLHLMQEPTYHLLHYPSGISSQCPPMSIRIK